MTRQAILDLARAHSVLIATAESCTAGMVATALTDLPGSSEVFDRGFVTYSNAAKQQLLGVTNESLDRYGAVSEAVAAEMAQGALARSDAQIAISVTGIAGPGASAFKPEGRVCFGLSASWGAGFTQTVDFGALGRDAVRKAARDEALALLLNRLQALQAR